MATPDRMRPVTAPPGEAATAAPLSPAMKAPDAATRSVTGSGAATGLAVVDDEGAWVVPVVAGADDAVVADEAVAEDAGADVTDTATDDTVVVDDPVAWASVRCDEPDEQAAPPKAMMTNTARSFIELHLTALSYTPLSTSAINSPISDGLRPTRHPAFSSASILAAAVPLEPETMAPAWPIFFPGGAVTPAT
jgi:hypothetical protein